MNAISLNIESLHARAVKAEQEVVELRRRLNAEIQRCGRAEGVARVQETSLRIANARIAELTATNAELRGELGDLRDEIDSLTAPQLSRREELR
jgi:uncharacterized protein involved in exopolysaccharide biosynthesis